MSHVQAEPSSPAVDHDGPDFTPRPNPDGSHALKFLQAQAVNPAPAVRKDNGARWQRNPTQTPVQRPMKRSRRKGLTHEVDAAVRAGMEEITSAVPTVTVTRTGQRMLVVDKNFYATDIVRDHRPQPIRKGAGKGPRKQAPVRGGVRC